MVKVCILPQCKSDSRKINPSDPNLDYFFVPFPKQKREFDKCIRWISILFPGGDIPNFLSKLNRNSYLCSKHFTGGKGPTPDNEDPVQLFSISPYGTKLHEIETPIGWTLEKMAADCWMFSKRRNNSFLLRVKMYQDLSFCLTVLGQPASIQLLERLPTELCSLADVQTLLRALDNMSFCQGNSELKFVRGFKAVTSKRGRLCKLTKSIYSVNCQQMSMGVRCVHCSNFRSSLRTMNFRKTKKCPSRLESMERKLTAKASEMKLRKKLVQIKINKNKSNKDLIQIKMENRNDDRNNNDLAQIITENKKNHTNQNKSNEDLIQIKTENRNDQNESKNDLVRIKLEHKVGLNTCGPSFVQEVDPFLVVIKEEFILP